jgi:hypothetical protein
MTAVDTNLGYYAPEFYANEALEQLENALGMASRVHRGFDRERATFDRGDVINIRKPATFAVQDAPASAETPQTEKVQLVLDQWKEVKFSLSDKDLAFTIPEMIEEHIRPQAYALSNYIDQQLAALYKFVPWYVTAGSASTVSDITTARQVLFDLGVPMEGPERMHIMIDGEQENQLLQLQAFSQQQGAGDVGVATQRTGTLGNKYGFEIFANQNVQAHTKGTASDTALDIDNSAGYPKGATTINLSAAGTGTLVPGDVLTIAGDSQAYVVTNTVTASGSAYAGVGIFPALKKAVADAAVVTASLSTHRSSLAFHRSAFAIAMAPLPDQILDGLGIRTATVTHPRSGVSLRSRVYAMPNLSQVHVALDILFGVKVLDPNMACVIRAI